MSLWSKLARTFSPKKQVAAITDEVVHRLVSDYDIRLELTIKDNKVIIDPVVRKKDDWLELPDE